MVRMPHWPIPSFAREIKYDLSRISLLLSKLGNPHLKIPPVIHVAGTNGKGSTIAYLKALFESRGLKTHIYTSPHLIEFNERIYIASNKIDDKFLYKLCEEVRLVAEKYDVKPTFFEGITAVAFLAFSRIPADIVLLETGLGGRLDATNVIPEPLCTIITSISYDHMEYLGNSLRLIAGEKAGIIKPNSPCVISCQTNEVYEILIGKCEEQNSASFVYEYDFIIDKFEKSFIYKSQNLNFELPHPKLPGNHQFINAANMIATATNFLKEYHFTKDNIETALLKVSWPARLQKIEQGVFYKKLQDRFEIFVDGAHNEGGGQILGDWAEENNKAPLFLIFGMTKNRDVAAFLKTLKPTRIYGILIEAEPSSYRVEVLQKFIRDLNIDFIPCESIEDAVTQINNRESSGTVLVTGSLFLAGDFLRLSGVVV